MGYLIWLIVLAVLLLLFWTMHFLHGRKSRACSEAAAVLSCIHTALAFVWFPWPAALGCGGAAIVAIPVLWAPARGLARWLLRLPPDAELISPSDEVI